MKVGRHAVDVYARRVVAGKLPVGRYHRLSCARHLRDRAREGRRGFPYIFRPDLADRLYRFAGRLRHYKGRQWAGKPIVLTDCQRFRLGSIVGWVHGRTGLRRFRKSYHEIPRKSGKSVEGGIIIVYLTFFDGEPGAEGYTVAVKRDQAKIVFDVAKMLRSRSPGLRLRIQAYALNLYQAASASKLEPLSADYNSMDGLNPHVIVIDEYHAQKDRRIIDVLETAMGARLQPHIFAITTAGRDPFSPCGDEHEYAKNVLDQVFPDETFFAFIAHADPEDDPFAERTWRKANPHYGVSVNPADMRALAHKARHMPSALAEFKQKRLNIWIHASTPWLDLEAWKAGQTARPPTELLGRPCWAGVDLSSKTDLSATALVFPPTEEDPTWRILCRYFTPEDGLEARERQARAPYRQWVQDGHLTTNPGNRIDHRVILEALLEDGRTYDLRQVGFDPWNVGNLATDLADEWGDAAGERVVEISQNVTQLSEPSKEFAAEVGARRIDAGGHPILLWNVSNAVVDVDGNENIKPTKNPKKARGRIDGLMAAIMGLKLARMRGDGESDASRDFAERGLWV